MGYEDLEKWQSQDAEIKDLTQKVHHLVNNCLGNMGLDEMSEINSKMKILIDQGMFWLDQDNSKRFVYDLKEFLMWLCDYIGDRERAFWNEEE